MLLEAVRYLHVLRVLLLSHPLIDELDLEGVDLFAMTLKVDRLPQSGLDFFWCEVPVLQCGVVRPDAVVVSRKNRLVPNVVRSQELGVCSHDEYLPAREEVRVPAPLAD